MLEDHLGSRNKKKLETRLKWIQEWIKDPKTPLEEIEKMLVFLTGSSALIPGKKILIGVKESSDKSPEPRVATCSYQVLLSTRSTTKEKFLEVLKLSVLVGVGGYSQE